MARLLQFAVLFALIATVLAAQSNENASHTETTPDQPKIKLSVYHNDDGTYKKRGEITGTYSSLTYTSTVQDEGIAINSPLYQVKIRDEATDRIILSSVKTCQLVAGGWADVFSIHLDDNNQVYHVDYYSQNDACVDVKRPAFGAKPVLGVNSKQKTAQKPASSPVDTKGVMEEAPVEEEKTFFQKYWYLILAGGLILVNNLSPPTDQPQQRR
ncbi:hypothetical protein BX666DRAFT_1875227 [Dichotomocladium elegans]|nr:hypothetical protein BX666DRAFT_1875227 [Dichotomocladium elegans]